MKKNDLEKNQSIGPLQARLRNQAKRFSAIHAFRTSFPETSYFSVYRKLFPLKTSLQDFHGHAFPKTAGGIFSNRAPKQQASALREILWALARALQFSEQIKEFLKERKSFEKAVLENNYDSATTHLNVIEQKFGKSIWLYQNKLASSYVSTRENENIDVANKIAEEVKDNNILPLLTYYIKRRIEGAILREKLRAEIAEKISEPTYLKYFQTKLFDFTDSSEEAVASLLYIDAQASVIDHYDSLIHVLQAAISDKMIPDEMSSLIRSTADRLYSHTSDDRLIGAMAVLGLPRRKLDDCDMDRRATAIEAYTENRYADCISIAGNILTTTQQDSALRVLYIKSHVAIGRLFPPENGIIGQLNENLHNVVSAGDKFFKSAHALLVLADRYCDHSWMLYLRVAVLFEIGAEQDRRVQQWMRDIYVRDLFVTPFTALCTDATAAERIISDLEKNNQFPSTIALVKTIFSVLNKDDGLDTARVARYKARELLVNKHYSEAASLYVRAASEEKRTAVKVRALGGASLALMLNHQYDLAVDTLINAYLEYPHAPTLLPVEKLVEYLPELDFWPNTISLGLLLNLIQQIAGGNDLSEQRLAFEKFCFGNSIFSPTDLSLRIDEFGLVCVIEYLSSVWQPEVMRQTLVYTSEAQIEEARIDACRVLSRLDPTRTRIHQEELASRIKQQEISKATVLVEQSKVYVDIESIKRTLRSRLKNSYAQYKSSLAQHTKPEDEIVRKFESMFSGIDTSLSLLLSKFHFVDSGVASTTDLQFGAIFSEIAKEFLTGDHGLNAYLSTRVRHGKFVDALRKAVMDEHLVTGKTTGEIYAKNNFWIDRLTQVNTKDELIEAIEDFTRKFDDLLILARDQKIQIRTFFDLKSGEGNTDGLFVYQFSSLERRLVQTYDANFEDFDELIVKCVDTLWEKTDANLVRVRKYLMESLKIDLMSLFDELTIKVDAGSSAGTAGLLNAIARARTATQQAMDNVVAWFRRNEVYDRQDFDIDFAPQIAASMVNRTMSMQSPWAGPRCEIETSDGKLPGRTLDALVDIFYVLFENAIKYAEAHGVTRNIRIKLRYHNGDFSGEVLSDALEPSSDHLRRLDQIRESLATPESRRLAQSEGRSGFRKIYIALENPLYKSPQLIFRHESDGNFRVNFSFKTTEAQ